MAIEAPPLSLTPAELQAQREEQRLRAWGDYGRLHSFHGRPRRLTKAEIEHIELIQSKAAELEMLYHDTVRGRHQAMAITRLEESVLWILKALCQ